MRSFSNKRIIFSVGILCTIVLSIFSLSKILNDEQQFKRNNIEPRRINMNGVYSVDSSTEKIPLPSDYRFNIGSGHTLHIDGHFNKNIPKEQLLIMRIMNLQVKMWVNGEPVYNFGTPGNMPSYAKSAGNVWDSFASPGISPDDKITLELTSLYAYHGDSPFRIFLNYMFAGYEKEIMRYNLSTKIQGQFLSSLMLCMGIVALVLAHVLRTMKKSPFPSLALAGSSIFGGIWLFVDFETQDYFMPYPIFNNSLDVLSMMITFVFLMIYLYLFLRSRWRKILLWGSAAFMILVAVSTATQFMHIFDYYDYVPVLICVISIFSVAIVILLIYEWRKDKNIDAKALIFSMALICVGELVDMIFVAFDMQLYIRGFKLGIFMFIMIQIVRISMYVQQENMKVQVMKKHQEHLKKSLAYQWLISEATKGMYENIYELDITNNCPGNAETLAHFINMGASPDSTYQAALKNLAKRQVKEEFQQEYIELFSRDRILEAYKNGVEGFNYDFMISPDNMKSFYWVRVTARLFFWDYDSTVRMLTYRQNINEEKTRELDLTLKAKLDLLSGLYNKTATEQIVDETLSTANSEKDLYALFILDIDKFKQINDSHGHAFGDEVIRKFSDTLRSQFRDNDIVGRIGGDEFVVFMKFKKKEWLIKKCEQLVQGLRMTIEFEGKSYNVSSSIGVAIFPEAGIDFSTLYRNTDLALYQTKRRGRDGFAIFDISMKEQNNISERE